MHILWSLFLWLNHCSWFYILEIKLSWLLYNRWVRWDTNKTMNFFIIFPLFNICIAPTFVVKLYSPTTNVHLGPLSIQNWSAHYLSYSWPMFEERHVLVLHIKYKGSWLINPNVLLLSLVLCMYELLFYFRSTKLLVRIYEICLPGTTYWEEANHIQEVEN